MGTAANNQERLPIGATVIYNNLPKYYVATVESYCLCLQCEKSTNPIVYINYIDHNKNCVRDAALLNQLFKAEIEVGDFVKFKKERFPVNQHAATTGRINLNDEYKVNFVGVDVIEIDLGEYINNIVFYKDRLELVRKASTPKIINDKEPEPEYDITFTISRAEFKEKLKIMAMADEIKAGDNVKYIGEKEAYRDQRGTVKKTYENDQGQRVVDVKAHGYKNLDLKNIPTKDVQKDNSPPKPIRTNKRFILTLIKKSDTGLISWR